MQANGLTSPRHAAAVSAARALATALDAAEARADGYATAQLSRPYLDILDKLGLVMPGEGTDDAQDALTGLGTPTLGNAEND